QQLCDVLAVPEELHSPLESARADERFELGPPWTIDDYLELHVGEFRGEQAGSRDERLVTLFRTQVGDGDDPPSRLRREGGQVGMCLRPRRSRVRDEVDAVRN